MTIIEAIKSGKPFRRPGKFGKQLQFMTAKGVSEWIDAGTLEICGLGGLKIEDLIATDWETKPEPRRFDIFRTSKGELVATESLGGISIVHYSGSGLFSRREIETPQLIAKTIEMQLKCKSNRRFKCLGKVIQDQREQDASLVR